MERTPSVRDRFADRRMERWTDKGHSYNLPSTSRREINQQKDKGKYVAGLSIAPLALDLDPYQPARDK